MSENLSRGLTGSTEMARLVARRGLRARLLSPPVPKGSVVLAGGTSTAMTFSPSITGSPDHDSPIDGVARLSGATDTLIGTGAVRFRASSAGVPPGSLDHLRPRLVISGGLTIGEEGDWFAAVLVFLRFGVVRLRAHLEGHTTPGGAALPVFTHLVVDYHLDVVSCSAASGLQGTAAPLGPAIVFRSPLPF